MLLKDDLDAFRSEFIAKVPPGSRDAMTRAEMNLATPYRASTLAAKVRAFAGDVPGRSSKAESERESRLEDFHRRDTLVRGNLSNLPIWRFPNTPYLRVSWVPWTELRTPACGSPVPVLYPDCSRECVLSRLYDANRLWPIALLETHS